MHPENLSNRSFLNCGMMIEAIALAIAFGALRCHTYYTLAQMKHISILKSSWLSKAPNSLHDVGQKQICFRLQYGLSWASWAIITQSCASRYPTAKHRTSLRPRWLTILRAADWSFIISPKHQHRPHAEWYWLLCDCSTGRARAMCAGPDGRPFGWTRRFIVHK